jgi:hypothetical protein
MMGDRAYRGVRGLFVTGLFGLGAASFAPLSGHIRPANRPFPATHAHPAQPHPAIRSDHPASYAQIIRSFIRHWPQLAERADHKESPFFRPPNQVESL